jgi:hypothetical protein
VRAHRTIPEEIARKPISEIQPTQEGLEATEVLEVLTAAAAAAAEALGHRVRARQVVRGKTQIPDAVRVVAGPTAEVLRLAETVRGPGQALVAMALRASEEVRAQQEQLRPRPGPWAAAAAAVSPR